MRRRMVACTLLGGAALLATACAPGSSRHPSEASEAAAPALSAPAPDLPPTGEQLTDLPAGEGKEIAESNCLACHSSDMIRQQRITDKQWAAAVDKMIRWGVDLPPADRETLLRYLSGHFGPGNDAFLPLETAPIATGSTE